MKHYKKQRGQSPVVTLLFLLLLMLIPILGLHLARVSPALAFSDNVTAASDNTVLVMSGNVPGSSYPYPAVIAWQPYDPTNNHWDTSLTGHTYAADAKWVWESYRVVNPLSGDVVDFKKTFVIPGNPTAGALYITCDNAYELRVNGNLVGSAQFEPGWQSSNLTESFVHTYGWQSAESWDITAWLVRGNNDIEIAAANEYYGSLDGQGNGTIDINPAALIFEVSIAYEINTPSVATDNATSVEETTATLHGMIADDGGEGCQYQFEYGMVSGGPYTGNTVWTDSKLTGEYFNADVTGLSMGTRYYFLAQAQNIDGIATGEELSFLTKPDAPVASTFTASTAGENQINLGWEKGEGAQRTLIMRKTGGFPVDRNDGVQVYFDTGTSFSDSGLSPDTTYYYRAWSEVTGSQQWSNGYSDVTATTSSAPPITPPTAVGGTIYPVNKMRILLPWLSVAGLLAVSLSVSAFYLLTKRRKVSSPYAG